MRYYIELIKQQFQKVLVYRVNWIFGFLSGLLSIFIQISIWKALYIGRGSVGGFNISEIITYVLISQIVGAIVGANFLRMIARVIRSGQISMELIRPVQYKSALFAEHIGQSLGSFLFELLPKIIVSALIFGIKPPASIYHMLAFIFLTAGAAILNYHIQFLQGILCFWVISPIYANSLNNMFFVIFSGYRIPLSFFPKFITSIASYLPFRFIYYIPLSVYLGKISPDKFISYFLIQWAWIGGIILIERFVWFRGIRKLVIQGG